MDEPAKEIQGRKRDRQKEATEGLPEGSQAAKKFKLQSPSSPMEQPAKNDEREDIEVQGRKREREEGATEGPPEGSLPAKRFRLQSPSSPMEQPERNAERDDIEGKQLKQHIPANLMLQGRQNYAKAHGKQLDEVKVDDLIMSNEGVVHWIVVHNPMLAQSAESQQCIRALNKRPIEHAIYQKLDPEVRKRFREEWYATGKDWNFVSLKRFKENSHANINRDKGKYCNWVKLCEAFGGMQFEESVEEATLYAEKMEEYGYPYVVLHPVTKKKNWLFVEKILESVSTEDIKGGEGWE